MMLPRLLAAVAMCAGPWYPVEVPAEAQQAAQSSFNTVGVPLQPRRMWPSRLDQLIGADAPRGRLSRDEQAEAGYAGASERHGVRYFVCVSFLAMNELGEPVDSEVPAELGRACVKVLAAWDGLRGGSSGGGVDPAFAGASSFGSVLGGGLRRVGRLVDLGQVYHWWGSRVSLAVIAHSAVRMCCRSYRVPAEVLDYVREHRCPCSAGF